MQTINLDFTVEETPRHKVYFLARAIRTLIDPGAYSSKLINAEGERVYRIVYSGHEEVLLFGPITK